MAFPLSFIDEHGRRHRFWWHDYPMVVDKPQSLEFLEWSEGPPEPVAFSAVMVKVWCGPAAHLPMPPTAEEFDRAVWEWLFR